MAKISNTAAYPNITVIDSADYLIITDKENDLMTKTCTLGDVQNLFGIDTLVAHVTLNNASLLTLGSTPAILIPAPGVGKVIDVISIMVYLDTGSIVYDFAPALPVTIGTESIASVSNASVNSATDIVFKPEVPQSNEVIAQNTALTLTASSNPTTGTGTLYFNVFYRILTVGSSF